MSYPVKGPFKVIPKGPKLNSREAYVTVLFITPIGHSSMVLYYDKKRHHDVIPTTSKAFERKARPIDTTFNINTCTQHACRTTIAIATISWLSRMNT